ncbi:unnamed protein product [Trichobilharzia regenti]|nr:unnamed protein product [Trichobilharzia regenti]
MLCLIVLHASNTYSTKNVLILGDMNADCGYLSKRKRKQIHLRTDTEFVWAIPDRHDTTLGKGNCAYDSISDTIFQFFGMKNSDYLS